MKFTTGTGMGWYIRLVHPRNMVWSWDGVRTSAAVSLSESKDVGVHLPCPRSWSMGQVISARRAELRDAARQ